MSDRLDKHRVIVGMSESGKTYKAVEIDARSEILSNYAKVFVNLIDDQKRKGYVQIDGSTPKEIIRNLIRKKKLIQYNANEDYFDREVLALKKIVLEEGNVIFILDECHLLKNSTWNEVFKLFTGGRHRKVYTWAISQRPQLVDRNALTLSSLVIFKLSMEDSYLKSYGIDPSLIPKEKYKFIVIDN